MSNLFTLADREAVEANGLGGVRVRIPCGHAAPEISSLATLWEKLPAGALVCTTPGCGSDLPDLRAVLATTDLSPEGLKELVRLTRRYECPVCEDSGFTARSGLLCGLCAGDNGRDQSVRMLPVTHRILVWDGRELPSKVAGEDYPHYLRHLLLSVEPGSIDAVILATPLPDWVPGETHECGPGCGCVGDVEADEIDDAPVPVSRVREAKAAVDAALGEGRFVIAPGAVLRREFVGHPELCVWKQGDRLEGEDLGTLRLEAK